MASIGFSVTIEHIDGRIVLHPSGELDVMTAPQLDRALESVVGRAAPVVVDLSGVRFVDCAGLAPIRWALRIGSKTTPGLRIVGAQPQVERVLQLTGLRRLLR